MQQVKIANQETKNIYPSRMIITNRNQHNITPEYIILYFNFRVTKLV